MDTMKFMFGSEIRDKIICTLSKNSGLTLKELSKSIDENYVSVYKIIKELSANKYVISCRNKYFLSPKFISAFSSIQNNILSNYYDDFFLHKKSNVYNLIKNMDDSQQINTKINVLLNNYLLNKINFFSKQYFDLKNKEFEAMYSILEYGVQLKKANVLEIGCGLGKISTSLSPYVNSLTSIDTNSEFIYYNKKKHLMDNTTFIHSSLENFNSTKKYDVIIFTWEGFHMKQRDLSILEKIKEFSKPSSIIIIVDTYPYSEFSKLVTSFNNASSKVLYSQKERLHKEILLKFKNLKNEIFFTQHQFDSISKITEIVKIQRCIFGDCLWDINKTNILKTQLLEKENPLLVDDALWISSFKILS